MITDDVKITVEAGHGGKGIVAFSKIKGEKGPMGGNGGNGGSVFFEGVADLGALRQFRFKKDYQADDGENGKSGLHDGANAEDFTLLVPVGTVCHNLTSRRPRGSPKEIEITKIGQRELIAKGGKGGKGNWFFRSPINTSPKEFEEGKPGEFFELHLELKMIADVGFIGLPNVGKSSLLNELTRAGAKVANYPFTTLEPNLGVYFDLILADIPGLIEGASTGKGLGIKFLRHIERTKVLFHFVSADSPDPLSDYKTVRNELETYGDLLIGKPEYIFLSKSDAVEPNVVLEIKKEFKEISKEITAISIIEPDSIEAVKKILNNIASEKVAEPQNID
ncbi:MAG: GTPase ObgE [Candidatus Staskawiczbacteria bacterium]|nr:GTPase ObgE [Candidatus Staskawiczbacteria bacterium]